MERDYGFGTWFVGGYGWARSALPLAVVALLSLPVLYEPGNLPVVLAYTLLPAYMIHQYEEHARGRFVEFFNASIGGGREVLTSTSAFWINVLGVWALFLASFYAARYVSSGFALVPVYATVVNGITHTAAAVAARGYNPGLYTSLAIFFPWGTFLLVFFTVTIPAALLFNGLGLLVALLLHAAIAVYALRRRRLLRSRPAG